MSMTTLRDGDAEAAARAVLDAFMDAFNAADVAAIRAMFHFPHVRFASGGVTVFARPADYTLEGFARGVAGQGWHHSRWNECRTIHAGPDKVHVDVLFSRYRADGSAIGSYRSIYIVVRLGGRWGIQARSSYAA
jgi:hypothetical protein